MTDFEVSNTAPNTTFALASARRTRFAAGAIGLVSLLLGVMTVGRKAFWYDEAFDARAVSNTWGFVVELVREREMSQAAYLVVLKAWEAVAGDSEIALRLPSVFAVAACAACVVLFGARLFDHWTGVIAGLLLATNDFVVQWSQQARTYSFSLLAATLCMYLFVLLLEDDRWRICGLYVLVAVVGVYFHFYVGFVLAAQALTLVFVSRRPRPSRIAVMAAAVVILITPALYFTATASRQQVSWIPTPSVGGVWTALAQTVGHNPVLAVLALVGFVVLAIAPRSERWRAVLLGAWVLVPVFLAIVTSLIVQPILVPRYLIVVAPPVALLAACALERLRRRSMAAAAVTLAAALVFSTYWIAHWYRRTPEDWRGAAALVGGHTNDNVLVAPAWAILPLNVYAPSIVSNARPDARVTLVVIRLDHGDSPAKMARTVVDERSMTFVRRQLFGERVAVETWRTERH